MNKEWEAIKTEYDQARACLREDGKDGWRRKQEEGWYHLWNAYHQAEQCETKEPLLYARILSMMNAESRSPDFGYFRLICETAEVCSAR